MSFLLLIVCFSVVKAAIPVNVESNIEIESHSGRYTQIKVGVDHLPLMVYNNENYGCVGIAHCQDRLCRNITINHIDQTNNGNNARFIYMKMSPITGLPQLSYAEQASSSNTPSSLKFVSCLTADCNKYKLSQIYNSSKTPPAYSMFSYDVNNNPLITVTLEHSGLALITCKDPECSGYSEPTLIAKGSNNGKYPSITTIYPSDTNDYFSIYVYYNEDNKDLEYTMMNMNTNKMNSGSIDKATNGDDIGKYSYMILSVNDTLNNKFGISTMYTDQTNGDLKYSFCNISYSKEMELICKNRVIDNIGIAAYGVFPEMDIYSNFVTSPLLSYFNSTSDSLGSIKFMECDDIFCDNPFIQPLESGKAGYGRDSSIAYYEGDANTEEMLWISFLDYNQNGNDKIARLLVVQPM